MLVALAALLHLALRLLDEAGRLDPRARIAWGAGALAASLVGSAVHLLDPSVFPRAACGVFFPFAATTPRWWLVPPNAAALVARARASTLPPGRARSRLALGAGLLLLLPTAALLAADPRRARLHAPTAAHAALLAAHLSVAAADRAARAAPRDRGAWPPVAARLLLQPEARFALALATAASMVAGAVRLLDGRGSLGRGIPAPDALVFAAHLAALAAQLAWRPPGDVAARGAHGAGVQTDLEALVASRPLLLSHAYARAVPAPIAVSRLAPPRAPFASPDCTNAGAGGGAGVGVGVIVPDPRAAAPARGAQDGASWGARGPRAHPGE